jgi:hypothetical protein
VANRWQIPEQVAARLRKRFAVCAYCGRPMKAHKGVRGTPGDKATFEHLNRKGPFYWSQGLQEEDIVIACARCNASRGTRRLAEWFASPYCIQQAINERTVANEVRRYLRTPSAQV